jgi:hypothetical protein
MISLFDTSLSHKTNLRKFFRTSKRNWVLRIRRQFYELEAISKKSFSPISVLGPRFKSSTRAISWIENERERGRGPKDAVYGWTRVKFQKKVPC